VKKDANLLPVKHLSSSAPSQNTLVPLDALLEFEIE